MEARDLMTEKVLAVLEDDLAVHAVEIMADKGISGLPVVNEAHELVGIVTESDLLLLDEEEPRKAQTALYGLWVLPDRVWKEPAAGRRLRVRDVMTRKPICFSPDDEAIKIARTLNDKRIRRVPIVEHGKLVGVVSRGDILRVMAEGKTLID
jgi:CBS domain-containing protein